MPTPDEIRDAQRRLVTRARASPGRFARGRSSAQRGAMNRTEQLYARHLEAQRAIGAIQWFAFEALRFKLADRCYYCPDFSVMAADSSLELHEIKGHMEDDAAVKLRVFAREYWMFRLVIVRRKGGRWIYEERKPSA